MPTEAEERIAQVQAQAPDVETGEQFAEASHWTSMGVGLGLASEGGPLGVAIFGAGIAGGYLGGWVAKELHTADYLASGLEYLGMHRIGQGGEHPSTVGHQVAHSNAFAGFLAAVAIGVAAALVVGAVVLSGGTALVVIGAAAAGGFATGFLGGTVAGALAQTGTLTGPIITGSPHLLIGGKRVARMTDTANCKRESSPSPIVQGSETILVDGLPMARIGHKLLCGAIIDEGAASVMIDKTVVQCATPEPEIPVSARVAADWLGFLPMGKVSAFLANRYGAAKAPPTLPANTGGKTSGVLRTRNGDTPLISGYKGPSAAMPKGTPGMNGNIKSHVEAHAAAIMREQGIKDATLYINKVPCAGKTGCGAMLPRMLPEGASLRVIGPDGYDQVFVGLPD